MKLAGKAANLKETLYRLYDRANDLWYKKGEWVEGRDNAELISRKQINEEFDKPENNIHWIPFGH